MKNWSALALCVSLANLFHLRRWWEILGSPLFRQANKSVVTTGMLLILTSVILLSGLWFAAFVLSRRFPVLKPLIRWAFFVVLTISLLIAAGIADPSFGANPSALLLLGAGSVFSGAAVVWQRSSAFRKATCAVTVASVLALPLFVLQTIRLASHWPYSPIERVGNLSVESQSTVPAGPSGSRKSHPRIVWMVFDELDQYLAFDAPGAGDRMPEFGRMRAESLYCNRVTPAHYFTQAAVPSMLNGLALLRQKTFSGSGAAKPWNSPSNLFRVLQSRGESVSILGSELNYCRLMGVDTARCYAVTRLAAPPHFFRNAVAVGRYWQENLRLTPIVFLGYSHLRSLFVAAIHRKTAPGTNDGIGNTLNLMNRQLPDFLTGPYDIVYIHWPVPHPAGAGPSATDYLDNLALADATLGNARRILENAGLWDDSIIVVGSDHHYRLNYWKPPHGSRVFAATGGQERPRIPLLIKMPNQTRADEYYLPFNALLIHDLMLELAAGRIVTPDQITNWLDRNRSRFSTVSVSRQ